MGVIINQSFKNMITTYIGFGIGAVNTLFLFTYFLEQEYYGLVSFLLSAANLIWPFIAFGVHSTLVKFFTSYKTRLEREKLLNLVLILPGLVAIILGGIGLMFYQYLIDYFSGENALVQPYIWLIFLIAAATAYFEVFFAWSKIYYKSVFGNFMKEVFQRFCISILLFAVYFKLIGVEFFIYGMSAVFVIRTLIMAAYSFSLHRPRFQLSFPSNLAPVLKYTVLILLAVSVATLLLDLDKVMIEYYLPIENVAIYGIAVYIATVISVPQKAMHQIMHPLTAEMLNKEDTRALEGLYKKSSLNLLIITGLIFILIITNVNQLYELIPEEYEISLLVVLLISLVKLFDNFLGNNNSILFNSDYYRIVLVVGLVMAVLAFLLNILFIPRYGINGAAIASFIAIGIYNLAKLFIVFKKFKIHPFTVNTWIIFGTTALFSLSFYYWDFSFHPLINIILKAGLTALFYGGLVYFSGISKELNLLFNNIIKKLSE